MRALCPAYVAFLGFIPATKCWRSAQIAALPLHNFLLPFQPSLCPTVVINSVSQTPYDVPLIWQAKLWTNTHLPAIPYPHFSPRLFGQNMPVHDSELNISSNKSSCQFRTNTLMGDYCRLGLSKFVHFSISHLVTVYHDFALYSNDEIHHTRSFHSTVKASLNKRIAYYSIQFHFNWTRRHKKTPLPPWCERDTLMHIA
jgi:hypothetical protein